MSRILVATLGGSWGVIPESYAFTNPHHLPLYPDVAGTTEASLPVTEIWVITTQSSAEKWGVRLESWAAKLAIPLRLWWPAGMADIQSATDARAMAELIHRLVYHAARPPRLPPVLSLAGGRKTMSADLQRAGQHLGHGGLIHVIDRLDQGARQALARYSEKDHAFTRALPPELAGCFTPLVVEPPQPPGEAIEAEGDRLREVAGPIPAPGPVPDLPPVFLETLEDIQRRAESLLVNYRLQLSQQEPAGNFRALYALPSTRLQALRRQRIGQDPNQRAGELDWLQRLPKAELHCHLGGILHLPQLVEVAESEAPRVAAVRRERADLEGDLRDLEARIRSHDLSLLRAWLGENDQRRPDFRALRRRWTGLPEPLGVCAFLLAFRDHLDLLGELIFGAWRDPARFHAIGIDHYEALGDLQGSGLLQSEATLRAALRCLAYEARRQQIRYLELRCSPLNSTRGELDGDQVVHLLLQGAQAMAPDVDLRLIFIASRHGDPRRIREHVQLAQRWLARDEAFANRFVGFDLAGAEHVRSPAELRDDFRPLRERVIHLTIHAGEGEPVENIWQAVYELNADRIGHGLTLHQSPQLLARFRDREIALEMCPSSNDQIVGFRDHHLGRGERPYPLADYLRQGLRVTLNTDDPGMSRTDLSREYLKAADLTQGGLSRWEVLQLIRNGFRAAFCSHDDRRRHLWEAEERLVTLLTQDKDVTHER